MEAGKLLVTTTGEKFQPVRVYYDVLNFGRIKQLFTKLKCMEYDKKRNRYVWVHRKEAKKVKLGKSSSLGDIVIGSFFTNLKNNEIFLETNSVERALEGIKFFDGKIKPYMAKIGDITIINKLFEYDKSLVTYSHLFDNETRIDPEEKLNEMKDMIAQGKSLQDMLFDQNSSLPEVERFPSHYDEDGLVPIRLSLVGRQHVATQHWMGNKNYSLADFTLELTAQK